MMPDREKVIKDLKDSLTNQDCGYMDGIGELYAVSGEDLQNAIALLKEQEAEPVIDIADAVDEIEVGRCPSCDKGIVNKKSDPTRYCKFCGRAVKWDG